MNNIGTVYIINIINPQEKFRAIKDDIILLPVTKTGFGFYINQFPPKEYYFFIWSIFLESFFLRILHCFN